MSGTGAIIKQIGRKIVSDLSPKPKELAHVLSRFLRPSPYSEIKMMEYDLHPLLWNHENWYRWLREINDRGVEIKIVSYEIDKRSIDSVKKIVEESLIKLRINKTEGEWNQHHYTISLKPIELIEERHHGKEDIVDVFYYRGGDIDRDAFDRIKKQFDELYDSGIEMTPENINYFII